MYSNYKTFGVGITGRNIALVGLTRAIFLPVLLTPRLPADTYKIY